MFAIVRTGGKQYRVAAGDKIAVEKLAGEAGDTITLDDVLLVGDGGAVKDAKGVAVSAEIIAQDRGEKVIVFKKRRRHNYRRKQGHRQYQTVLKITAVGAAKKPAAKKAAPAKKPAAKASTAAKPAAKTAAAKKPAAKKAPAKKPAAKKAAPKKTPNTDGDA
ncbi:MAG: 50S ribosomal protein L21 [Pseudomonadota bacterium]